MRLICYPTRGAPPTIELASPYRAWMEETRDAYAYRCLPLSIANSHGWELLCPASFSVAWNGGAGKDAIAIRSNAPRHLLPESHFGEGVLTFRVFALFRTDPGYNLWVSGPVNQPKDGIVGLTGIVETDWAPYTFTMNWKFTRPCQVHFSETEPFCSFFPIPRGLVEDVTPEIRDLDSVPETKEELETWHRRRNEFNRDLRQQDSDATQQKWQKDYYLGKKPDGSTGLSEHQTKLRVKPFADRRQAPAEP